MKTEKAKDTVVKGYKAIEEGVVAGYNAIENGVVGGYKTIEEGVVNGYKKVVGLFKKKNQSAADSGKEGDA